MNQIDFSRSSRGRPVSAFAAIGMCAALWTACGEAEAEGGPGGFGNGMPPMPVDVATAVQDTAIDEITATGEIEAIQSIELRPEVDGRIVEIYVREGMAISRGRPLFKVDDAELTAQVARLEAERDLATQALARTRALLEDDATSQAELEEAEARARSSQASLDLTQVRLDRTVVRAPFGGVVGERLVSLGDYVTSATRLVTLQTVNPQRAAFEVPERHAERLAVGQQVNFRVAAVSERTFTGEVDFVDPRVRLPARTIMVKAVVPNRDRVLKAGMFIEVRLATEVRPDAVMIPEDAILPLETGFFVWVVTPEGQATRRQVELGIRTPGSVEILNGVEVGEQVVTGGLERLFEGGPVMPRQPIQGELIGEEPPGGEGPPGEGPAAEEPPPESGS
jgi:membrane fusion protein (multidrug efflux system)